MAVLTAIYVIAGGYLATAINDFIQGLIMLGGLVALIAAVLASKGGFAASLDALARVTDPSVTTTPGVFTSFFGPDPLNLLFVVVLTSLGTWGLPQMVQKFYAIKNEDAIRKGTVISTLFAFVVAGGCYFLGGFGRLFGDKVDVAKDGFDAIVPAMLSGLGPGLIALTVILVLSASMSTLSSLVMTSSSTLTVDFIRGTLVRDMTQKRQVLCIRILLVVFIAVSAALALVQYNSKNPIAFIAQMMGISWGAMAGAFLAPLLYSLYWKGATKAACWASFVFAVGLTTANVFGWKPELWAGTRMNPIHSGAIAMLAGFVIVPVVSWLTRAPDRRFTDALFACYERPRQVMAKTDLGD
jgi:SSS family solute:Na+ symporter